jgi:integrase/recombinase XerD
LPDFLIVKLKERLLHSTGDLIFPAANGGPDGHMLRKLKVLGRRAGITTNLELHKFRKSFATHLHRNGTDAKSIQKMLGHADLATTVAYLEGENARSQRSRNQVNETFGVFA